MSSIDSFVSVEIGGDKRAEKISGNHIAQKLIAGKKKKVYDIHGKVNFNASQSNTNRHLLLCGRLYDEAQDFWKKRFPECTDYIIVQEKIPKFLEDFFEAHLPRIGITISYPKTKEELETGKYFQLGWYDKDNQGIEKVYHDPIDNRSAWQRFRNVPLPKRGEFSHFCFFYGTHMLSDSGKKVLDEYARVLGYRSWDGAYEVYSKAFDKIWNFDKQ